MPATKRKKNRKQPKNRASSPPSPPQKTQKSDKHILSLPFEVIAQIFTLVDPTNPFATFSLRRICRLVNHYLVSEYFVSLYLSCSPPSYSDDFGLSLFDRFFFSPAAPASFQLEYADRVLKIQKGKSFYSDRIWAYVTPSILPPAIGRITQLTTLCLKGMHLQGNVPMEMELLVNLKVLDLSKNRLSGTLDAFADMQSLTDLCIQKNEFTGILPANHRWMNLKMLSVSHNRLTGGLGPCFNMLNRDIELIYCNSNLFTGDVPDLREFSNLYHLFLNNNCLTGELPPFCEGMNLRVLVLTANELSGSIEGLGWEFLHHLTKLDLAENLFMGSIPRELGSLSRLEDLNLHWNSFENPIPNELGSLANLIHLKLSQNNLEGPVPIPLARLSKLRFLQLDHNFFSGTIPQEFSDSLSKNLSLLALNHNNLEGPLPNGMGRWGVKRLFLKGNQRLKGERIPADVRPKSKMWQLLRENGFEKYRT
ncbi:L domain-like protein [Rhizoclosmatium globosum]|uniref:L domain-like protein n=1 Tax=Rhizoclosmatium globosum TaxID=329046 RepID=A0A1Y2CQ65_9FUNG|nr:L domain-like protein [Rhizoclosmatium globosum]|eukprot:ORY49097.1 L domain-like protein [Rhizoclosmatium globosum]